MIVLFTHEPYATRLQDYLDAGYSEADYIHDQCHQCDECGAAFDKASDLEEQTDGSFLCEVCIEEQNAERFNPVRRHWSY